VGQQRRDSQGWHQHNRETECAEGGHPLHQAPFFPVSVKVSHARHSLKQKELAKDDFNFWPSDNQRLKWSV
jgi:hypothetical protein